jgi:hypothetical protein
MLPAVPVERHRYPEELTAEQREQLKRSRVVDAEAYLRWLETGEGCPSESGAGGEGLTLEIRHRNATGSGI